MTEHCTTRRTAVRKFSPPLYVQRAQKVLQLLQQYECRSFIDAGCSKGVLLQRILASQLCEHSFSHAVAIDLCADSLREALQGITSFFCLSPVALLHPMRVEFVRGDLTKPPLGPEHTISNSELDEQVSTLGYEGAATKSSLHSQKFDAVISVEVLEHIHAHDVLAFTEVLFVHLGAKRGARIVIITTPNRDCNPDAGMDAFPEGTQGARSHSSPTSGRSSASQGAPPYDVRHTDHKFEMTAEQFRHYCDYVVAAYRPYWVAYTLFGVGENFTQGAIFHASPHPSAPKANAVIRYGSFSLRKVRVEAQHSHPCSCVLSSPRVCDDVNWTHQPSDRHALFQWEKIFPELPKRSDELTLLAEGELCAYCCYQTVNLPYKSLQKRVQDAVCEVIYLAQRKQEKDTGLHVPILFGDISSAYPTRVILPRGASLCALAIGLLREERRCKRAMLSSSCDTCARSSGSPFRAAVSVHRFISWILYDCWGKDALQRCLENDTHGSAMEALSDNEICVLLFLFSAKVLRGATLHLGKLLESGRWYAVGDRRRGAATKKIKKDMAEKGGLTLDFCNRIRMQRLADNFARYPAQMKASRSKVMSRLIH
ncbi:hypothetical protein ERJ75_000931200 [Trypanosoma vivax]|uniref:Small RNA 2'-O-methyltransferase n=1 Tax=Trypanosoma vivax (strain Y486) TaxID=1055687 RepID=G0U420_TRYVY|nr:hypothetical protein TRVL_05131 [Trypanosoma vivax]KAH8612055.1 hypothetical protein ERJ75_000931200 [Trypanosoma vivax]CCC52182.1 conserved hypothetical protein [Trypanosoma vivax Y486]